MGIEYTQSGQGLAVSVAKLETMADPVETGEEALLELSIVMPCLNEAETLAVCIEKARRSLEELKIAGREWRKGIDAKLGKVFADAVDVLKNNLLRQ